MACTYDTCCHNLNSGYGYHDKGKDLPYTAKCWQEEGCVNSFTPYGTNSCPHVTGACSYAYVITQRDNICSAYFTSNTCKTSCGGTPELTGYGGGAASVLFLLAGLLYLRRYWWKAGTLDLPNV